MRLFLAKIQNVRNPIFITKSQLDTLREANESLIQRFIYIPENKYRRRFRRDFGELTLNDEIVDLINQEGTGIEDLIEEELTKLNYRKFRK